MAWEKDIGGYSAMKRPSLRRSSASRVRRVMRRRLVVANGNVLHHGWNAHKVCHLDVFEDCSSDGGNRRAPTWYRAEGQPFARSPAGFAGGDLAPRNFPG